MKWNTKSTPSEHILEPSDVSTTYNVYQVATIESSQVPTI